LDEFKSLANLQRIEDILRYIDQSQRVTVKSISDRFQISMATARRDLEILSSQGRIQRVHGGATSLRKAPPELSVYQRMNDESDAKKRIGRATAQLIHDGETIFLGSGTTVLEVARALADYENLTVITNSVLVLNELIEKPSITVVALGGILRRSELSLIGHIAEQSITDLNADKVIIGIHGIDPTQGLTNHYLPETMTDRKILKMGKQVIIVADHTKCPRISIASVAPIKTINTLVTDTMTSDEFVQGLTEQGIQVLRV
jgi:DeoR/GlpR family transcriptional regulator of sugar metabolism